MNYFIPQHLKGRTAKGVPYEFFRGIHVVPDALADSHEANSLGIVPVEEMSDDDWRLLGLDKATWMTANRPKQDLIDAQTDDAQADDTAKPAASPEGAVSAFKATSTAASADKTS